MSSENIINSNNNSNNNNNQYNNESLQYGNGNTTVTSSSSDTSQLSTDERDSKKQQMWFHEISEKLQVQSQLNDSLKEKNLHLLQQYDQSEQRIEAMRQELDLKNTQIQSIDHKLKELKKSYAQKEEEVKKLRFLNDELMEWKETHKINEDDYFRLKEALRVKDVNIDSLSTQLEHSVNRNAMLSESLKEISERTSIFDRDDSFNISSANVGIPQDKVARREIFNH
ncbi:hypothetical protein PPL_09997 [Heterostelium album PN500]|uniref:Uncharacterized protein n=1 Tax=Heterostelium pallidum (strain ATCC 26659 / Pp 5 / PN500) TaxID=670386 RepID=D3BPV3_HETP5|nr:hypothetical protein PPL_09997 [Heterostelium album PN500]EFA76236.1 hypothetical protein PPL_09997 [Heterostelium album PN500]|eukprot:XP_020428369.1 hypothetical protein PPL_09997 [Heterostelium album PN500]